MASRTTRREMMAAAGGAAFVGLGGGTARGAEKEAKAPELLPFRGILTLRTQKEVDFAKKNGPNDNKIKGTGKRKGKVATRFVYGEGLYVDKDAALIYWWSDVNSMHDGKDPPPPPDFGSSGFSGSMGSGMGVMGFPFLLQQSVNTKWCCSLECIVEATKTQKNKNGLQGWRIELSDTMA